MTKPNHVVTAGNVVFANDAPLSLIAGPCQLESRQHAFDMAGALAWTLQLVLFVLVVQQMIVGIENFLLRYRAVSERAM